MAEDIYFRKSDGRICVEWKISGFSKNMFVKKNTSPYDIHSEVTSPPFSLFNSTWHIQAISSTYELWLKVRLCKIDSPEDSCGSSIMNPKTVGVPVSYKMGIQLAFGDKTATDDIKFSFENTYEGEWCRVLESRDINKYHIRQVYWKFSGFKDFATVICSFLLDPNSEVVELPLSIGNTSSSDNSKEMCLCKSTMTLPEDFRDVYHNKSTLTSPEDLKDLCLSEGTMTSSEDSEDTCLIKDSATLSENFKELYISQYYTDVTLKVKCKEFHAHRIVLVARSKVFASMFKHETAEKTSGLVEIPDCDPDCFEDFLLFLYSGKVDIVSATNAIELYKTSDKYDVQELKDECVRCMARELTVDSFCDVVLLATIHDESELLTLAINFFIVNLDVILPATKWQTFLEQYPLLGNELFMKSIKK